MTLRVLLMCTVTVVRRIGRGRGFEELNQATDNSHQSWNGKI